MYSFECKIFELTPKIPFGISRAVKKSVYNVIVNAQSDVGPIYGEAAPNLYYGETPEQTKSDVEFLLSKLSFPLPVNSDEIKKIWDELKSFNRSFSALAAVDMLLWDFVAKNQNVSLQNYLNPESNKTPMSSVTVALGEINEMVEGARSLKDYPILKIKMDSERNFELLEKIRNIYSGEIRVDANCGWPPEKLGDWIGRLQKHNVEFLEQPLPPSENLTMHPHKKNGRVMLMADESCIHEEDIKTCVDAFHGVNIKLAKCGGITPAINMIRLAKRSQLKIMLGCMLETNIGISAALSLAPQCDYLDLDGNWLLSKSFFDGVELNRVIITHSGRPGLGVSPAS